MPHLSPTTLTNDEQRLILRATAGNLRDHLIYSLALGTGLRLAEVVGLNVGDVFAPDGTPRVRVTETEWLAWRRAILVRMDLSLVQFAALFLYRPAALWGDVCRRSRRRLETEGPKNVFPLR